MQKYWKSIALVVVILAAITVYYTQSANFSDKLPHFTFKQEEGNVEAVETVAMKGNLQYAMSNAEAFKVTAEDGTNYMKDESFFKRLQGFYHSEKYEQRKEEHRSFMRGKTDHEQYYDETKDYLAYAQVHFEGMPAQATLMIDVLEKDSGDRIQIEEPLDRTSDYRYMNVTAVKIRDNQLYVITEGESNEGTVVRKYRVDLNNREIMEKEKLYTAEGDRRDSYSSMSYLFDENHSDTEMMVVEKQIVYDQVEGVETTEITINHAAVYDIVTNEKKDIDIPEDKGAPVAYDDTTVYLSKIKGNELKLAAYDWKQEEVTNELPVAIETPTEVEVDAAAEADTQYVLRDGKLYIAVFYLGLEVSPQLMVVDSSGFDLTYKGEVISKQPKLLNENGYRSINYNEMEVLPKKES